MEVDSVTLMGGHTPPSCDFMNMEACSWELIAFLVAKVGRERVWTDALKRLLDSAQRRHAETDLLFESF